MPYKSRPPILIVDDELAIREGLTVVLEQDYKVETCATATEALAFMKKRTFAVAVVDIKLPDINGEELLAALKKGWPLTEVIIITALKEKELAQRCFEKGAFDFVVKPWDHIELQRKVRRASDKFELERKFEVLERQLEHGRPTRKAAALPKDASAWSRVKFQAERLAKAYLDYVNTLPSPGRGHKDHKDLFDAGAEFETHAIQQALAQKKWNKSHAAELLAIYRLTLTKKMKTYKISSLKSPKGLPG